MFWQPTFMGATPFPHALVSDFAWLDSYAITSCVAVVTDYTVVASSIIATTTPAIANPGLFTFPLGIYLVKWLIHSFIWVE